MAPRNREIRALIQTLSLIAAQLISHMMNAEAKVSSIIVFGDSTVDSGNNNHILTALRSDFLPYGRDFNGGQPTGRFSNGRLPTDFLSEAFGLKPTIPAYLDSNSYDIADFASGVCFASAGTGFDEVTSRLVNVMPLGEELVLFKEYQNRLTNHLGIPEAERVLSEALYVVSIGTNDFLENYYTPGIGRSIQYSIEKYQTILAGLARKFITDLYKLGARKISLTGLPPMGCLPIERTSNIVLGGQCIHPRNVVAKVFNSKLQQTVLTLNKELPSMQLVFSNPYDLLSDIIDHPYRFGYDNAAVGCCGSGFYEFGYMCNRISPFTCTDADRYVFWDAIHPTEKTNRILANHAFNTSLAIFH